LGGVSSKISAYALLYVIVIDEILTSALIGKITYF